MEVYVKEKPKNCWNCQFMANEDSSESEPYCVLCNKYLGDYENCPLKSLSDFEAQVRAEELKKLIDFAFLEDKDKKGCYDVVADIDDILNYITDRLEQLKGESK